VGSVIRYFKVRRGKYVRRSTKGLTIFLNFLKNILDLKYFHKKQIKIFLFKLVGVDFHINTSKRIWKKFLQKNPRNNITYYMLNNIKISFTKTKDKKIKSIKKRLKKKLILNYLKTVN